MSKTNKLDALKAALSSKWGAEIAQNRAQESAFMSYEAANQAPRDRNPRGDTRGRHGDKGESFALNTFDRATVTREILDLYRNDGGLISTIISRVTDHVVGDGVFPQARTSSKDWNESAEKYFKGWSKRCDAHGREMAGFLGAGQILILADAFFRGESYIRTLEDELIQFMESPDCKNPTKDAKEYSDGVKLNDSGAVLGFNFQTLKGTKVVDKYVGKDSLVHAHLPFLRAKQYRGVPILAPVVPRMQQITGTTDAMQLKVLLEAQQTLAFTGPGAGGQILNAMPFGQELKDSVDKDFTAIQTDQGMWYDLPDNKKLEAIATKTPSGEHVPYMIHQLEAVCAAAGIPYSIALMLVGGSYSATRGQMIAFEKTVAKLHKYISDVSQIIWEWVIGQAIQRGELGPAPTRTLLGVAVSEFDHVEWTHPPRLTLSPTEDEKVNDAKFARGSMTITDILKQSNREREDVWNESEEEITDAINRAKKIEKETGVAVDYTLFLNKVRPGAGNPSPSPTKPKGEPNEA